MIKTSKALYYIQFVAVIACFCYILAVFPFCLDEWCLLKGIETGGIFNTLKDLFLLNNSRLSNISAVLLLNLPNIFYILIETVALIVGCCLMVRLAEIKTNEWKKMSFFVFMFVFTPMWQQSIFSFDWAFNYIVPIPLLFGMIYMTLKPEKYPLAWGIVLGLILGVWHESFSLLYLTGFVFIILSDLKWANKKRIFWFIAVLTGFLWLFLNPGSWNRVGTYYHLNLKSFLRPAVAWPYFAYLFVWIITFLRKKSRAFALQPVLIFFLGGCSFIPFAVLFGREIAGFPAILAAICGLTILYPLYLKNLNRGVKVFLAIFFAVCTLVHLVAIVIETNKLRKIYDEVSLTLDNADKTEKYVFGPTYYSYEAPLITLRMPYSRLFDPEQGSIQAMAEYRDLASDFIIVPEELKEFSPGNAQRVNSSDDIRLYNGLIVSPNVNDTAFTSINVKYENMDKWWNASVTSTAFVADNDSQYVFIYPRRNMLTRFLGKPVDVSLN